MSTEQWEKDESKDIQLYFRQQQWFFGVIGILLESGLMHPINEMAFQVALHQLNKSLKELNFAPASRMIHQARLMSRVIMMMGIMDSNFCREHGFLDGFFVPTDLLRIQDQLVMSLSHAWAGLQQVLVARLYVSELTAIMKAVMQIIVEQKYGDFASMFCQQHNDDMFVDLEYVVLNIGHNSKAWDSFCGVVSQALKSNKMSKDQVKGHIKHLFLDNESPWLTVQQNHSLDLLLDSCSDRHIDVDFLLPTDTPLTVNAIKQLQKSEKLSSEVFTKKHMSRTHVAWAKAGASINPRSPFSKFFPFLAAAKPTARKRTWVNDLGQGVVKISTYALLLFCQKDYQRQFEKKLSGKSLQLSCVTNTHMAVVPSDLSGIHTHVPYLVDVQRMHSGTNKAEIVNQKYVNTRIHAVLQPKKQRRHVQTIPRFQIPEEWPLGFTCAQQHIDSLVKTRPENPPSVHRLFVADPEAVHVRFAPYVLMILTTSKRRTLNRSKDLPSQRALVRTFLRAEFADFLWPVDENMLPWNATKFEAKDKFTEYLVDIVLELFHCTGTGRMAQAAANEIDSETTEYAHAHNSRIAQAVKNRSADAECASIASDTQHPFLLQWDHLHKSNPAHVGAEYVKTIRAAAREMIQTWREKDFWWVSLLKHNKYIHTV